MFKVNHVSGKDCEEFRVLGHHCRLPFVSFVLAVDVLADIRKELHMSQI
jgi:hypothetical protein